MIDRDDCMSD